MLALLDADIIAFVSTAGKNAGDHFDEGIVDVDKSLDRALEMVEDWKQRALADSVCLVFSDARRRNFRKVALGIEYKAGRATEKPEGYFEVVRRLQAMFPWQEMPWLEGDDVLGIIHTTPGVTEKHDGTVIVSADKDMKTIPGLLFNPNKMEAPVSVTRRDATWFWMYQTLMGDAVDGYKGCPGIGEVKAERILPDPHTWPGDDDMYAWECWSRIEDTYAERAEGTAVETRAAAVAQARAARILHASDYDMHTASIRLFHPQSPEWVSVAALESRNPPAVSL